MSRRQHVVRTDDQGGIGAARSLGGCRILCAHEDCGSINQGDQGLIAPITFTSTRNYQRCFVSATIGHVNAWIPDPAPPPGPGEWTVRFECDIAVPEGSPRWRTVPYNATATASEPTVVGAEWGGSADYVSFGFTGITAAGAFGSFNELWDLVGTTQDWSPIDPPYPVTSALRLEVQATNGPVWCTLTFSSPHGEDVDDVVISDGSYP